MSGKQDSGSADKNNSDLKAKKESIVSSVVTVNSEEDSQPLVSGQLITENKTTLTVVTMVGRFNVKRTLQNWSLFLQFSQKVNVKMISDYGGVVVNKDKNIKISCENEFEVNVDESRMMEIKFTYEYSGPDVKIMTAFFNNQKAALEGESLTENDLRIIKLSEYTKDAAPREQKKDDKSEEDNQKNDDIK